MAVFRNKILAGSQFTGVDENTGLFLLGSTGDFRQQVRVNSISFHTTGGSTTWTLTAVDPDDSGNEPVILTDTADDFRIEGMLLTKEENRDSWGLRFVTTGMTADGWLVVDYDAVSTPQ